MTKKLSQLHQDVPANHYDQGFKNNFFQRYWHTRRISEIRKITNQNLGTCLDIGCHGGFITEQVLNKREYKKVFGIDVSQNAIKKAQLRIKKGEFKVGDVHNLPFKNNFFDTILCLEVLEHVENPKLAISELKRVLKKNGTAIILVPTDSLLFRSIWLIWNQIFPVWKDTHIQSFRADKLIKLLKKEKFIVNQIVKFNLGMLVLIKASK